MNNKRIRELADQAELIIRTSKGTYMSHPEFNKKFAELIVLECISIADQCREDEWFDVSGAIKEYMLDD